MIALTRALTDSGESKAGLDGVAFWTVVAFGCLFLVVEGDSYWGFTGSMEWFDGASSLRETIL